MHFVALAATLIYENMSVGPCVGTQLDLRNLT